MPNPSLTPQWWHFLLVHSWGLMKKRREEKTIIFPRSRWGCQTFPGWPSTAVSHFFSSSSLSLSSTPAIRDTPCGKLKRVESNGIKHARSLPSVRPRDERGRLCHFFFSPLSRHIRKLSEPLPISLLCFNYRFIRPPCYTSWQKNLLWVFFPRLLPAPRHSIPVKSMGHSFFLHFLSLSIHATGRNITRNRAKRLWCWG